MGQRSQLYIRYRNKKTLVAMHLQWNYGFYMINRTYQLLDYIKKNVENSYSNFKEEHFDIANSGSYREDLDILHNLIQMNLTIGSYVGGHDLVKEAKQWGDYTTGDTFKIDPEFQDNNNGILVIDVLEDGTIKYGLGAGPEDVGKDEVYKMTTASEYFKISQKNLTGEYEKYRLENCNKELYDKVLEQIEFIDNNFTLLTQEEYKDIFNQEYEYKNCLKENN